jgi:acyl-coenzyme A thioesterase PaaI-like protein
MSQNSSEESVSQKINEPRNFVKDFLFGRSAVYRYVTCIRSALFMDLHTEGWIGIPHGGIGMGAIMHLTTLLGNYPKSKDSVYPLSVDFRMGGAHVWIGDAVNVKVAPLEDGAHGIISVDQNTLPYISAVIGYRNDESHRKNIVTSYIPESVTDDENNRTPLPYYKNCFVCGVERGHPGLQRRFYFLNNHQSGKMVVSTAGFDAGDKESFFLFKRHNFIHPLAFLALLDETMGWAGFMATASGAVTVRISYTFYREVHIGERLVFFGRSEKVKGNIGSRLFYWASGGAAVIDDKGRLEIVIACSGQYLGVAELTEQMKMELIPQEYTSRAFSLAGT